MRWLFKWIGKNINRSLRADMLEKADIISESNPIRSDGMNFTIYRASGGYVIEYRSYDRKKDTNNNVLYIITDDKDLGAELGKILSFESLRY